MEDGRRQRRVRFDDDIYAARVDSSPPTRRLSALTPAATTLTKYLSLADRARRGESRPHKANLQSLVTSKEPRVDPSLDRPRLPSPLSKLLHQRVRLPHQTRGHNASIQKHSGDEPMLSAEQRLRQKIDDAKHLREQRIARYNQENISMNRVADTKPTDKDDDVVQLLIAPLPHPKPTVPRLHEEHKLVSPVKDPGQQLQSRQLQSAVLEALLCGTRAAIVIQRTWRRCRYRFSREGSTCAHEDTRSHAIEATSTCVHLPVAESYGGTKDVDENDESLAFLPQHTNDQLDPTSNVAPPTELIDPPYDGHTPLVSVAQIWVDEELSFLEEGRLAAATIVDGVIVEAAVADNTLINQSRDIVIESVDDPEESDQCLPSPTTNQHQPKWIRCVNVKVPVHSRRSRFQHKSCRSRHASGARQQTYLHHIRCQRERERRPVIGESLSESNQRTTALASYVVFDELPDQELSDIDNRRNDIISLESPAERPLGNRSPVSAHADNCASQTSSDNGEFVVTTPTSSEAESLLRGDLCQKTKDATDASSRLVSGLTRRNSTRSITSFVDSASFAVGGSSPGRPVPPHPRSSPTDPTTMADKRAEYLAALDEFNKSIRASMASTNDEDNDSIDTDHQADTALDNDMDAELQAMLDEIQRCKASIAQARRRE